MKSHPGSRPGQTNNPDNLPLLYRARKILNRSPSFVKVIDISHSPPIELERRSHSRSKKNTGPLPSVLIFKFGFSQLKLLYSLLQLGNLFLSCEALSPSCGSINNLLHVLQQCTVPADSAGA